MTKLMNVELLRVPKALVLLLAFAALVGGLAIGTDRASGDDGSYQEFTFADGVHQFCSDRGRFVIGVVDFDPGVGFATAESAASAYVSYVRDSGSGPNIPAELHPFNAPARQFDLPVKHEIDSRVTYFDKPSASGDLLEARVTVEKAGGLFHVAGWTICLSQFNSDPERYEQLKAQLRPANSNRPTDEKTITEERGS